MSLSDWEENNEINKKELSVVELTAQVTSFHIDVIQKQVAFQHSLALLQRNWISLQISEHSPRLSHTTSLEETAFPEAIRPSCSESLL